MSFLSARFVTALVTAILVVVAVPLLIVAIHANAVGVSGGPAGASVRQSSGTQLDATSKGKADGDEGVKSQSAGEGDDGE